MNDLTNPTPRTRVETKSQVRFNATRYKLTSQILLPQRHSAAYADLLERFTTDYAPKGEAEITLVAQMATATWRLNQSQAYEMSLMALHFNPDHTKIARDNPIEVEDALAPPRPPSPKPKPSPI